MHRVNLTADIDEDGSMGCLQDGCSHMGIAEGAAVEREIAATISMCLLHDA
jgi:hypothetical protein